jgi:hypothetical protein
MQNLSRQLEDLLDEGECYGLLETVEEGVCEAYLGVSRSFMLTAYIQLNQWIKSFPLAVTCALNRKSRI